LRRRRQKSDEATFDHGSAVNSLTSADGDCQ
jgi:hypothetical protein